MELSGLVGAERVEELLEALKDEVREAFDALRGERTARYWIDGRDEGPKTLLPLKAALYRAAEQVRRNG